jgi:hypothetical protein
VQGTHAARAPLKSKVAQVVRRLANQLDQAVDPRPDDHAVVSEALIRLALAMYVTRQGAEKTRDRLMTLP